MLNPKQRSALRGQAHKLEPVVIVGGDGLTAAVLAEIERNLAAHELIKVRVADGGREEREDMLRSICVETRASPVQHIGKILVVFRERPPETDKVVRSAARSRPARKKPGLRRHAERPGKAPARGAARRGARAR